MNEKVSTQISRQLANHFNKVGLFQESTFNSAASTNYYLTGNLTKFYGAQKHSTAAAVGSQFGLIGAAATTGIEQKPLVELES